MASRSSAVPLACDCAKPAASSEILLALGLRVAVTSGSSAVGVPPGSDVFSALAIRWELDVGGCDFEEDGGGRRGRWARCRHSKVDTWKEGCVMLSRYIRADIRPARTRILRIARNCVHCYIYIERELISLPSFSFPPCIIICRCGAILTSLY